MEVPLYELLNKQQKLTTMRFKGLLSAILKFDSKVDSSLVKWTNNYQDSLSLSWNDLEFSPSYPPLLS